MKNVLGVRLESPAFEPGTVRVAELTGREAISQLFEIERVAQIVESASPHGFNRVFHRAMRRQQDHFDLGPRRLDAAQYFQAVHPRQAVIEQDDIGRLGIDYPKRFLSGIFYADRVAVSSQIISHGAGQHLFIVDDEYGIGH